MSKTEDQFPTIADLHSVLADFVAKGYGDLPVQVLVVPNLTLQILAHSSDEPVGTSPALMVEITVNQARHPVSILTTAYLDGSAATHAVQ